MIHGTIKLFTSNESLITEREYVGRICRRKIIAKWMKDYGAYEKLIVQIFPEVSINKVRKDGLNIGSEKTVIALIRPPSKYDNENVTEKYLSK